MYSVASCDVEIRDAQESSGTMRRADADAAWKFLLAGAASPFSGEHRRYVRSVAEGELDWHAVLGLAKVHGLLPIVQQRLIEMDGFVPDGIKREASEAFEQNARQTLWLTQLLLKVSELFQREGIEALPYKGPVLAQLLYGNVTLRQYSDIDVLVQAADVPRARIVLQQAGFRAALQLNAREERAYIATGYEYTFHSAKNPNVLELQWRILSRFYAADFEPADFFIRSRKIQIGDTSITTLGAEDLMLVLCGHAAKHAWCKLSWIRDVAELSQARNLDWDQVLEEAARAGIQRIVGITFLLAMKMFSTPVPDPVQRLIETDIAIGRIAAEVSRNLERGVEPDVDSFAYFRFVSQLRERRRDRLRFWWRLAGTPSVGEWSVVRLPTFLFPLYRVVRAGRLVERLIRSR
jgi:Uncharacterised nucleotidyltransferase